MMDELLDAKQLIVKLNIGRSTIDKWEKEGKFPKRINISANRIRWKSSDINEWLNNKMNSN